MWQCSNKTPQSGLLDSPGREHVVSPQQADAGEHPRQLIRFQVNAEAVEVAVISKDEPLLWVLRERLGLKGAKFGCGHGGCGACVVHAMGSLSPPARWR
jgi:xanthine dehydrogenase iron-sulfur cluster and FAD-binding subunit A